MKLHAFKRDREEYSYSRTVKCGLKNLSTGFNYIEYGVRDEKIKRSKEAARCYAAIGNIPMMLNRLYSAINLELEINNNL